MAKDLFYLASYKNVGALFEKIQTAKAPEAFTTRYLTNVIGLKSVADRNLINMLKKLGFLDPTGKPTEKYSLLKNKHVAGAAIADGLRNAYAPLFDANEKANELPSEQLKGLISQVTGTDANGAKLIAYTFNAIAKQADFSKPVQSTINGEQNDDTAERVNGKEQLLTVQHQAAGLRTDFHFNIQVHLPANGTEETYLNIFNALRRTFS